MLIQDRTIEDFDAFVDLPENEDKLFELINGEIVEKVPSNTFVSEVAQLISFFIRLFIRQNLIPGHVTGEQGGYMVNGERYAPDVAYISNAKQAKLSRKGYNPNPPEFAVEVELHTSAESERRLRLKILNYLAAGTLLWVVYPEFEEIEVYAPGKPMQKFGIDDTLNGGDVLPGFMLAAKDIFEEA